MAGLNYIRNLLLVSFASSVWGQTPTDFSMQLEPETERQDGSNIYIGQLIPMKLTINFTVETSSNTKVEILTSVDPTIYAIREVDATRSIIGGNLAIGNPSWLTGHTLHSGIDQSTGAPIEYKTRAVLDLGEVSNSGSSTTTLDSQLTIYYTLVHVSMAGQTDGTQEYTTSGMEYLGETRIYVVQLPLSIYPAKATNLFDAPSFTLDAVSQIELMTPLTFALTMTLPGPSSEVTVTVSMMAGLMDELYVQKIQTRTVGAAFSAYVNPELIGVKGYEWCPLQNSLDMYMGVLINSESQRQSPNPEAYDIIVDITCQVEKRSIVGKNLTVAVGVAINGEEFHVAPVDLLVVDQTSPPTQASSFTLEAPSQSEVSSGWAGSTTLNLTIPRTSNLDYVISLSTALISGAENAMTILAVNPVSYGVNMPCHIHPTNLLFTRSSSGTSELMDTGLATFNLSNFGFNTTQPGADDLSLEVVVMMMPNAAQDDQYELKVTVGGLLEQSTPFTVAAPKPYDKPVNYVFTVANKCNDTYESGTVASFQITVKTERDKTPGPGTIEVPIPENLTESTLTFVDANIISKGANVLCVQLGKIKDANLSDWTPGSGENDRAVLTLPLLCNMGMVDSPEADEFVIEFKVAIKDDPEILNATANVPAEFSLGFQYSESQIFVATYEISIKPPTDLMDADAFAKVVTGLTVPAAYMPGIFPDDIKLQWSSDNVVFYDNPFDWEAPVEGVGQSIIKLKRPLVARHVRVVNKNGNCLKDHLIDTTMTDLPEMYGPVELAGPLLQNLMLTMDNDSSTCIQMPNRAATASTPYLWLESKKHLFGGLSETSQFTVKIVGEGIQCHNRYGPQVTYVTYPKAANPKFQGNKIICTHTGNSTVLTTKTECNYTCSCAGQDQCSKISLLMLHHDATATYSLCDITVTDI